MHTFKASDSVQAKFGQASIVKGKGGTLTRKRRATTFRALEKVAREGRWGNLSPATMTEKQFMRFMEVRREVDKITARCQALESSHIRRALRGAGREDLADRVTNEMLGVQPGSRIGTGTITNSEVLERAREAAPENVRALIDLCDGIGLRIREAVCSGESLKLWKIELEDRQPLTVEAETKGGKPRSVFLRTEESRELACDAIERGLAFIKESGQEFLIPSVSEEGAVRQAQRELAALGLESDNSAHSLRRDFAVREYLHMKDGGMEHKQILQKLSMALGHGPSRGRWVWNNYLRSTLEGGE
jgi:site-specific recombinase XerD